jgi:uncharacterized protein (DUF4213/DUF364 family)
MSSENFRRSLIAQVEQTVQGISLPAVTLAYVPEPRCEQMGEVEFGVIGLADGSAGLYYAWLGATQRGMPSRFSAAQLEGSDVLPLVRNYAADSDAERSIGLAAINAITDWWWRQQSYVTPIAQDSFGVTLRAGDRVGFIGFFAPLIARVRAQGIPVVVIERKAQLLCAEENLLVTDDPAALRNCSVVIATAAMCLNDSLEETLRWCSQAREISLIGPTAGFFPDLLFARGISCVGGVYVTDAQAMVAAMKAGQRWQAHAQRFHLRPTDYAPGTAYSP